VEEGEEANRCEEGLRLAKDQQPGRPLLRWSRDKVSEKMDAQVSEGEDLLKRYIGISSIEEFITRQREWSEYNLEFLKSAFTGGEVAGEFSIAGHVPFKRGANPAEKWGYTKQVLTNQVAKLRSILKRLELFEEPRSTPSSSAPELSERSPVSRDVFLVHGRGESMKQQVARLLEGLDLRPIILHEKPDKGRTIIEKFEDHADVAFAVVLLAADDQGRLKGDTAFSLRARQNVVLELGYFIGKLGRERVCALVETGVEIPSDLHGVLYIPFEGAWKLVLARELKASGIVIDMNRII
jgi:predicted nucleotide-binding protein